jgi:hypothetical protein
MCCVFKYSRPVKKNSGGVLTKVGLCIEGCFSIYNTRLNYVEYTKCNWHIFVIEEIGGFQCTWIFVLSILYNIGKSSKDFIIFFLL